MLRHSGMGNEELLKRLHALDQALGIIQPVDADHQSASLEACNHVADERRPSRPPRQALECGQVDADRKAPDAYLAVTMAQHICHRWLGKLDPSIRRFSDIT